MQKRSAAVLTVRSARPSGVRWSLLTFAIALMLAFAVKVERVSATTAAVPCGDATTQCSVTEELANCISEAMREWEACKQSGGFLHDAVCYAKYVAAFYACFGQIGENVFIS